MTRPNFCVIATFVCVCTGAVLCTGQAWVPPKGEGDISIVFQNLYTNQHFFSDGTRFDAGKIRLLGLMHTVDFGITDKLAVTGSLPVFAGKYNGTLPHQFPIDNGNYNGSTQDLD